MIVDLILLENWTTRKRSISQFLVKIYVTTGGWIDLKGCGSGLDRVFSLYLGSMEYIGIMDFTGCPAFWM